MAIGTAGALIGGTIASSLIGANSASKAADAQADAANDANETQRYIYDSNVELNQPRLDAGNNALAEMQYQLGLTSQSGANAAATAEQQQAQVQAQANALAQEQIAQYQAQQAQAQQPANPMLRGNFSEDALTNAGVEHPMSARSMLGDSHPMSVQSMNQLAALANGGQPAAAGAGTTGTTAAGTTAATSDNPYGAFQASPGYQWSLDQGNQALERSQSARGMRLSGAALEEAMGYNTGMANNEYGNYWNRLAGLGNVGQTAVSNIQNAGTNYANAYGQNAIAAGNARASGYQGVNDALQGGMNNLFGIAGMQQAGYFS